MADTGAVSPGTLANDSAVGTSAWTNPSKASTNNESYAAVNTGASSVTTNYLKATNFDFSTIPSGATIDGITVSINRNTADGSGVQDSVIRLVVGGTVSGDNKSAGAFWTWNIMDTTVNFGGSSDTWGLSLSDTEVKSSDFGVVLSASVGAFESALVDHITMTVYYTATGWAGKVNNVTDPASVIGVLSSSISSVIGVT